MMFLKACMTLEDKDTEVAIRAMRVTEVCAHVCMYVVCMHVCTSLLLILFGIFMCTNAY